MSDEIRNGVRRAFKLDVIGPEARQRETDEEMQFHFDMRVRQLMQRGMTEPEARAEATTRFAGAIDALSAARDELHVHPTRRGARERAAERLADARRDAQFAFRSLRRAPTFAILAIVTLALGIGASTAIFSVVRGIVLRPLPYDEPAKLVNVQHESMGTVAPATYLDWQRQTSTFQHLAAAEWWSPSVRAADGAVEIDGIRLTSNHIPMLGVKMALGRSFTAEEAAAEPVQVTVLSHAYWQARFGSAPDVIGTSIVLNGRAHTIVGVMPPRTPFVPFWANNAQLAVPLVFGARTTDRDGASLRVIGRLRASSTAADAAQEFAVIGDRLAREFPGSDHVARLVGVHEMVVGSVRNVLFGVLVAVTCVLLIACANVAHLQLMRNASRSREFAIRSAIGGTRTHLLRQSLGEALLVTGVACLLGLLLARAGIAMLVAFAPPSIPRVDSVQMDFPVMAFAAAVSCVVALIFALLPALSTDTAGLQAMLRNGGGSGEGRQRVRLRGVLVMSEFAMALVLLTTAGLVVRTVRAMHHVDAGFDASNVLTLRMSTRGTEDSTQARRAALYAQVIERVSALNGVVSVGAINHLPLDGDHWRLPFIVEGAMPVPNERASATFRITRPGYFDVMRIDMLEGRVLTAEDEQSAARAVVVNRTLAVRRWPGQSAIGKRLSVDGAESPDWFTVVGVAEDTRRGSWTEQSAEEMYFPNIVHSDSAQAGRLIAMLNPQYLTLVVRTSAPPLSLAAPVKAVIRDVGRNATVSRVLAMQDVVRGEFAVANFYLTLFTAFAVVAVSLALIGVYGVLSYSVARRRKEIGVRLALGARRMDAFVLVLRQGMTLVAGGAAVGLVASLLLPRLISSLLYGVQPADPLTMGVAATLVAIAAAFGCAVPAWRAARTNPLVALRDP